MKKRSIVAVAIAALAIAVASSSLFVVEQGQVAVVFALGKVRLVLVQPGLYAKWPAPLENVMRLEKRGLILRSDDAERYTTSAQRELVLGWSLRWHIADPTQFVRSFGGSMSRAESQLHDTVKSALGAQVAAHPLAALLGPGEGAVRNAVLERVAAAVHDRGIALDGFELSRVDLAADQTQAVYARMGAERRDAADQLRAQGKAEAQAIRGRADKQRSDLLAQAYARAQRIEGEGDAKAAAVDAASFGQDPGFAAFYRSMAAYRATFNQRSDLLVLDPSSAFLRYMRDPDAKKPSASH
ncbi:modulator of FtsH protease HflC [mine drainage metagenome]|uniref:Modulator of FtsH protease HflC n=1 Tax=mine drainage metagenome TaxID=410659 RepID=A0A1J5R0N8_9ZZZZ